MNRAGCALVCGCQAAAPAPTSDTDAAPPVEELHDGWWHVHGSAIALPMGEQVRLTYDAETSAFALDQWTFALSDAPDGGVLRDGTVVLLGDDPHWAACGGPALTTTLVEGVCADDGTAFELHSDPSAR